MTDPHAVTDQIRAILKEHAHLTMDVTALGDDADLYLAGMTSHASVSLMLALENQFNVEFPDRMLRRQSFESVAAIRRCLAELLVSDG